MKNKEWLRGNLGVVFLALAFAASAWADNHEQVHLGPPRFILDECEQFRYAMCTQEYMPSTCKATRKIVVMDGKNVEIPLAQPITGSGNNSCWANLSVEAQACRARIKVAGIECEYRENLSGPVGLFDKK